MRKTILVLLSAAVVIAAVVAPASLARPAAGDNDIVTTAVGAGQFTTLATLLTKAGLVDTLKGPGPFTVFAPTDEAFAKVPKATLDALAADPAKLKAVLLYHVVQGAVTAADVAKLNSATSLEGESLAIKVSGGSVYVDGAKVTTPDVTASNGVIHVIDSVLIPKSLQAPAAPSKNIVQTAVGAGGFKT